MSKFLYLTYDRCGGWEGGANVVGHESHALSSLGETVIWDRSSIKETQDPFEQDKQFLSKLELGLENYRLAHMYAGCLSESVYELKKQGTITCYTAAAHSIELSRKAHLELGIPYDFDHLNDPKKWQQYLRGYKDSDVLVVPSSHSENVMRGFGCTQRIEIIPHGVEIPEKIVPLPKLFSLGYLGSYGVDKNVKTILQAWKKLAYKDAILYLGGRDSLSPFVTSLIHMFGGGNIVRLGWMKNVSDFYNKISLYCQASACLIPGSPVFCKRGFVPIEQLNEQDEVLVDDGIYRKVIKPLKRKYSGTMMTLKTTGINIPVTMTPEHRIFVIRRGLDSRKSNFEKKCLQHKEALRLHKCAGRGSVTISRILGLKPTMVSNWIYNGCKPEGKGSNFSLREDVTTKTPEWIPARELERLDVVLFPRIVEEIRKDTIKLPKRGISSIGNRTNPLPDELKLDSNALEFLGFYVSEGCAHPSGSIAYCFHKEELNFIDKTKNFFQETLGLFSKVEYGKNGKKSAVVWANSILLFKFLTDNFGRGAHNKTIPNWVLLLPKDQLTCFLRGVWLGDGSKWALLKGKKITTYSTVSQSLSYQLFCALVKLGYMPTMQKESGVRGYSVSLTGNQTIKFARNVLQMNVNILRGKEGRRCHIDEKFYYMPVREISEIEYVGDVYNLEVEKNHCYCAPFVVHNSEGFGLEVVEAEAHGRVTIASHTTGASDFVPYDFRFDANDVDELCELIDYWKDHHKEGDLGGYGLAFRERVKDITWDKIEQRYVELWRSLL